MKKRLAALVLAGAMAVTSLTGCAGELDNSEVAVKVNGEEVTADIANFYARFTQAQYEMYYLSYYGEDMWGSTKSDDSYQSTVKDSVANALVEMFILEDHMADYGVEYTAEDMAAVEKATAAFLESNSEETLNKISGSEEVVEQVLGLLTIQTKMVKAIEETADLEVSDEEAAQMKMEYVVFPFTETAEDGSTSNLTADEEAALREKAEGFAAGAKDAADFAAYASEAGEEALEATFDAEETQTLPVELVEAASVLKEGETTALVESTNGLYVARLVSEFDEEATEAEKDVIRAERMSAKYEEVMTAWRADAEVEVFDKVWAKMDFDKVSVSMKVEE